MPRRVHTPQLSVGHITLDARQAHHLRDVLRITTGEPVELFDDAGAVAHGVVRSIDESRVVIEVHNLVTLPSRRVEMIIASAIPKGERADWMVEKLSELGIAQFIPLISQRSVVVPQGKNKLERWQRIATESAKQSRRRGVMRITEPMPLDQAIELVDEQTAAWHLATREDAMPIRQLTWQHSRSRLLLFIGPEGGWAQGEAERFQQRSIPGVRLTETILRVETAAIAAAAIAACGLAASQDPLPARSDNVRGK